MSVEIAALRSGEQGFTGVDDSSVKGRRGGLASQEPSRQGPASAPPRWGAGSKSDAAPGAPRNGLGGVSGGGGAAAPSLDSSKHNRNTNGSSSSGPNKDCGITTFYRRRIEGDVEFFDWARFRCKAWACEVCGPKKASRLRKAIVQAAAEHDLTRFLTLTLDPGLLPSDVDSVTYIRGMVWAKFRIYLKRRYRKAITYIAVLEFTKAGIPHLHILVDRFIPQPWISASWKALGGGRIVHIERVHDMHRMTHYLGKYLTKGVILSAPAGVRRYTVSRGIRLFEKRPSSGQWRLLISTFNFLRHLAWKRIVSEEFDHDGQVRAFTTDFDLLATQAKPEPGDDLPF